MKTIVSFVDCDAPYTYRDEFGNVDGYVINKDGDVCAIVIITSEERRGIFITVPIEHLKLIEPV
jgi:hypothetical protein